MANAWKLQPEDVQNITNEIVNPIYVHSENVVRQIFPIVQDLKAETQQLKYYTKEDDIPYGVGQEVKNWLGHVAYGSATKDTMVISENLHYGYDELQRIQGSPLPVDERMKALREKMIEAEQRVGIYGATVALDNVKAQTSFVSGVGTTSVASTAAAFNVTTYALGVTSFENMLAQIISGLGKPPTDPLALLMTTDVYGIARSVHSLVSDRNLIDELNDRMKKINSASPGVLVSDMMGATITWNGNRNTMTAGTLKTAMFNINSQYYRIHTSPMFLRTDGVSNLSGQHILVGERFTPLYIKKQAIIYEATTTIA